MPQHLLRHPQETTSKSLEQAEAIFFSNAKGLVAEHVNNGLLNFETLESAWSKNSVIEKLQKITRQKLSIDDLQQHPELENSLH